MHANASNDRATRNALTDTTWTTSDAGVVVDTAANHAAGADMVTPPTTIATDTPTNTIATTTRDATGHAKIDDDQIRTDLEQFFFCLIFPLYYVCQQTFNSVLL